MYVRIAVASDTGGLQFESGQFRPRCSPYCIELIRNESENDALRRLTD